MLKMDGFEVLSVMNRRQWIEDIPVIMISSEDSSQFIQKAYEYACPTTLPVPLTPG